MSQNRKLSFPADNPEYFNVSNWQGGEMTMASPRNAESSSRQLLHLDSINRDNLEPTNEVMECLENIEKLAEKQNGSKSRTKKRLGSLKRLFSTGNRRGSSAGVENEYLPSPSPSGNQYGSLPSTPTKVTNNNVFRLSSDSAKTATKSLSRASSQLPPAPSPAKSEAAAGGRLYYNVADKGGGGGKPPPVLTTPLKSCKPPTGQTQPLASSQRQRLVSGGVASSRVRSVSMSSRQESVWPGMEAPPLPQLHATCRGYKVKDLPNVVILFFGGCNKSRQWREFIGKEIETSQEKRVGGQRLEEFGELSGSGGEDGHNRRFEEMVYHCDLVIVILSRKFIEWLQRTKIVIGKILQPPSRVLGVFVDLRHDDITPAVANCLETLPCWKTVVIEDTGENSDFMIGKHCQEILSRQQNLSVSPPEPKFKLFPRKLSPGQSKLLIILDVEVDTLDREQFQLKVIQDDFHYGIEDAKWIKDDLVQVEFPSVMFQSTMIASLSLRINETNYGSRQIKLENAATMLDKAWQHCTDPVTVLSEAFDVRFVNHQDIDEYLSWSVEKKCRIPELLSSEYRGCCSEHARDCCGCLTKDHTNLLHFAANHGFSRLCHTLMVSGYKRYLNLPNILGLTPAECAEKCGHHDLAQELRGETAASAAPDYQQPGTSGSLAEGEDGYLIPHPLPSNDYQVPNPTKAPQPVTTNNRSALRVRSQVKPKTVSSSSDEFYQVPPTPVPLASTAPSLPCGSPGASVASSSSSSAATPPKFSMARPRQGGGYIQMLPPRKAMSEPKVDSNCFIPKSGSFSHFTSTAAVPPLPPSAVSREELIARYCGDPGQERRNSEVAQPRHRTSPPPYVRPGSTPPESGAGMAEAETDPRPGRLTPPCLPSTSRNIVIPASPCPGAATDSDSSPLEHYIHTDGLVYLPMESPEENDPELSALHAERVAQPLVLDPASKKTLLNRLSPSRTKIMRSFRRKSGGSVKHDDNDNEIDPIQEDSESYDRPEILPPKMSIPRPRSQNSNIVKSNKDKMESFLYYDIPRQISDSMPSVVPAENIFTEIKPRSSRLKNNNEGAYENVIIQSNINNPN